MRQLDVVDLDRLFEAARAGDQRALGRLLTLVDDAGSAARRIAELVAAAVAEHDPPHYRHVIGLTGAPGVGKSTLVASLADVERAAGRRVAVLAVDPSSALSGGALLGDRIRMQRHALDPAVYIRSLSSRGRLGGLSAAVPDSLAVLEVCPFDVLLVETVGVGQAEVAIAGAADTVAVVLAPGAGDSVQFAKAGILEVADIFVVNKCDLEGAAALENGLRRMLDLGAEPGGAPVPAVMSVAAADGTGMSAFAAALDAHLARSRADGGFERRRRAAARWRVEAVCRQLLAERAEARLGRAVLEELSEKVLSGELDVYSAAEMVLGG